MERRGQIGVAVVLAIAIGIVIVLFGFGALFSNTLKLYIVGGGILALTLIYIVPSALQGRFTRQKRNFVLGLILVGAGVIALAASGVVQTEFGGGQYIQVPLKGFYTCEPSSAPVTTDARAISGGIVNGLQCPANTDSCDIILEFNEAPSVFSSRQVSYTRYTSPSNILTRETKQVSNALVTVGLGGTGTVTQGIVIPNVAKGQFIDIRYEKVSLIWTTSATDGAQYRLQYRPFILFKTSPTGGKIPYSSVQQGCSFTSTERPNLIISDTLGYGAGSTSSLTNLDFGQTRNFIDLIIPISVENARIQGDKYCSNSQLYQIDAVETGSASYRVVNTNKATPVECCNGDVEPGIRQCVDNHWKALPKPNTVPTGNDAIQCSFFKPCSGSDETPYTSTQLVRSVCENSICVQKTRTVECTTNAACGGALPVCDAKLNKCVSVPGAVVAPLNASTKDACASKASSSPWLGYTYVESQSTSCGFVCSFGFTKPTVTTTAECKPQNLPYFILGGAILVLGGIAAAMLRAPRRRGR